MEQMRLNLDAAAPKKRASSTDEEEGPKASATPKILSVSDVNKAVRGALESEFRLLWVKGEISNFKHHNASGHFYFSLKDAKAQINAIMFKGFNQGLKFKPTDGMEVIVRGKITVYEPRGSYQIFCELMDPVGAGAMQIAFEQLKKKLHAEGLFARERKRPLPKFPRHVVVVTAQTGAAIRDILNILGRRFAGLQVTVISAVVQGDAAPASIIAGITKAQLLKDVDVLIVGRGGGSIEDMWGFNDERVARAIAASRIPTISAVGHEIDTTIADYVADVRAPTPSAAAELVVQSANELIEIIGTQRKRLVRAQVHFLQLQRQKLNHESKRLIDPKRRLQDLALRCDELEQRLQNAMRRDLERREQKIRLALSHLPSPREMILRRSQQLKIYRTRLEGQLTRQLEGKRARWARLSSVLDSISPLKVVERGYSITFKEGRPIKDVAQIKTGDKVELTFAKGRAQARIEKILEE